MQGHFANVLRTVTLAVGLTSATAACVSRPSHFIYVFDDGGKTFAERMQIEQTCRTAAKRAAARLEPDLARFFGYSDLFTSCMEDSGFPLESRTLVWPPAAPRLLGHGPPQALASLPSDTVVPPQPSTESSAGRSSP